jgi:hypothetical protein
MLKVLFLAIFLLPMAFQIVSGFRSIFGSFRLKLWQVSVISLPGLFLATFVNLKILALMTHPANIHDGLPMIGVLAMGAFMGALLLVVIIIQSIVYFLKKRKAF